MTAVPTREDWPVLRRYDLDHLARIALPLGGIGTGTVSLGGRGDLRDWEIANRPAKGYTPRPLRFGGEPFFALYARPAGGQAVTRVIEGPIERSAYEGPMGSVAANHGLPRFSRCAFAAAYPLGQVTLSDPEVPVDVRIEAYNPLVPADTEASGIPVAVLRYVLINRTDEPIEASVCGSILNYLGMERTLDLHLGRFRYSGAQANRNEFRDGPVVRGISMWSEGLDPKAEAWGTFALTTTASEGISYRTVWPDQAERWGQAMLRFWDDFGEDGILTECAAEAVDAPMASLAVKVHLDPGASEQITFLLTWHFPNRYTWTPSPEGTCCQGDCCDPDLIGNYYTTQYADAWDVAQKIAPVLAELESRTVAFVRAFSESDLPEEVKEAALFNLSTLRTQTCFRTADGRFYGWEGSCDGEGCCYGSCTHVWNYEQATAFLYGDLAKSMREVEFAHATRDNGHMSFRVNLPLDRASEMGVAAADGQMGCILKMYRDWQLSGDDEMLRGLWAQVKKALAFCWIEGGWDADQDGVMEGCQHNTMDVEYYGPNPQMGSWYLGALRAAEEMARYLGDDRFAHTCRDLFERGKAWLDDNLFNGEYYVHQVRPAQGEGDVAPGLRSSMGATDVRQPDYQLGAGCLVDQLVGQYLAHVCGLGYLLEPAHVQRTLKSILKYNYREGFHGHFNCSRSYVLGDEAGLLMASYPKERPAHPFPYYTEVMTGFEYAAAVHMLYEGQVDDGLRCIRAIRERYDGLKRNPFDEAECGHHYARAMASWAAVLALTGFHYSAVTGSMTFSAQEGQHFWSNGYAWGTCRQRALANGMEATLQVLHGSLTLRRFELTGIGGVSMDEPLTLRQGGSASWHVES